MLAARNQGSPPIELTLDWLCERYRSLPEPGGIFEQDYKLIKNMAKVDNIYSAVNRMRNLHGEAIHSLTTGERRIIRALIDMGVWYG